MIIGDGEYIICATTPIQGHHQVVYWGGLAWTTQRDQALIRTLREGMAILGDLNGRNARLPGMRLEMVHGVAQALDKKG